MQSIIHGVGIFLLSFSVSMALGVACGLAMSLILKHSSLNLYPSIESCLVALSAYTCYFLSNGLSMSGIVSLLFCGITLKHYAYHTMSRRTQRTTKYIFATLAQLSENFIFIYLGLSLFTSAPTTEPVTSYVKPVFIVITTIAVIFTRYAAVFPLSQVINFLHKHARGQRTEELPHSYQMMLFWAGLRGAVGVALAAGFKGHNAQILRTTVLIVVVLTVVLFGGTTARILEVLGIRTGVEDEAASSSDEEESPIGSRNPWFRRNGNGRWGRYRDDDPAHPQNRAANLGRIGTHYARRSYNHQAMASPLANQAVFSAASSDSFDSDSGDILPMASPTAAVAPSPPNGRQTPEGGAGGNGNGGGGATVSGVGEDGKWFQALDERYLLPLFSNATASRTFHARKARKSLGLVMEGEMPGWSEDEGEGQELELAPVGEVVSTTSGTVDSSRVARGLPSPVLRSSSSGENR
jgi:sodium/hydrogen exchanger-like protein 6/7